MAEYENTITVQQADRTQLRRMAWLIDCDNTSWRLMSQALAVAAAEGNLLVRRAYGDWSDISLHGWRETCIKHAITQIHVTTYSVGKNSTDLRLTIDAMELCLTGRVEAVCIVSGDSDFAPLAHRLREHGIHVLGIGAGAGVSEGFAQACDRFQRVGHITHEPSVTPEERGPDSGEIGELHWTSLVNSACANSREEDGWVDLGWAGNYIRQLQPNFNAKSYGFPRLTDLIASRPDLFEIEARRPSPTVAPAYWARIRVPEKERPLHEPLLSETGRVGVNLDPSGVALNKTATPTTDPQQDRQDAIIGAQPVLPSEPPRPWQALVAEALQQAPRDEDGWLELSELEQRLRSADADWSPQRYGADDLITLLDQRQDLFEIEEEMDDAEREVLSCWIRLARDDDE